MAANKKTSKSPKAVKKADLKKATGGSMAKAKVAGWTNPQKTHSIGAQQQDDSALSAAQGGSLSKAKVAGWTNPQKTHSTGAQQQGDDALSGAVGGMSSVGASSKGKTSVDASQRPRLDGADIAIN